MVEILTVRLYIIIEIQEVPRLSVSGSFDEVKIESQYGDGLRHFLMGWQEFQ